MSLDPTGPGTAPAGSQDQPVTTANVQPAVGQGGNGPWAQHLARFDEAVRPQVDEFLRTEIQPYITRLEQKGSVSSEAQDLYEGLTANPGETYLALTEHLFGEEAVQQVLSVLMAEENAAAAAAADEPVSSPDAASDPEVEAMKAEWKANKQKSAYDAEMDSTKQKYANDPEGVVIKDALFHPFVHAADGDFDLAYQGYKEYYQQFRSEFAPPADGTQQPVDTPPPTLGSDTQTASAPPTEPTFKSIGDALDSFFDSQQNTAPPVVGGV